MKHYGVYNFKLKTWLQTNGAIFWTTSWHVAEAQRIMFGSHPSWEVKEFPQDVKQQK